MNYYRNLHKHNSILDIILDDDRIISIRNENDLSLICNLNTSSDEIIINDNTFTKANIINIIFTDSWNMNYIPDYFGYHFINLQTINELPNIITSIGTSFMVNCTNNNFNKIIFPNSLQSIGRSFYSSDLNHNKEIDLSNTQIKHIPDSFITHNYKLKSKVSMPLNIQSINSNRGILINCYEFTGPFICDMSFVNALPTPSDKNNFNNRILDDFTNSHLCYTQGIRCKVIDGTFEALHEKLPDLNGSSSRYRKLIEYIE